MTGGGSLIYVGDPHSIGILFNYGSVFSGGFTSKIGVELFILCLG